MALLDKIQSPSDLKNIPQSELPRLAREIRQRIVDVVSKTGGHLASNLGMVELSIALHYVFDAPKDKIVWDVGHQSYTHKLLTGRKERFHTLRQHEGLSGFPRISESPYDAFSTGHSSTSISAGLGMVAAKRLKQEPHKVVSVIGDGSMTAGMAYEGLNQAGDLKKDLLVILNDNEMSISKNVGALSSLLSRTFSARYLQDLRKEVGEILRSLPGIGNDAYQFAKRAEESFKAFVTPGILFEAFNFDYFGPIKGHRLDQLIDMLENIKNIEDPVLLHVVTQKGRGYEPAEKNPVYFHGVGSFRVETGDRVAGRQSAPSYTQIFGQTMMALASADERLIAVTAAMPEGTGLVEFSREFPDRFFDVGIAEQHGVTFAAGMASEGLKPVVAIYSTFLQRAYDQLIHDVCLESLPVTFAVDRGGIVGEDGPTHHGLFDFSYLRSIPNMTIMAPMDENELVRMMQTAVAHQGPIALRYPRGAGQGVDVDYNAEAVDIGKAKVVRTGDDLLIIGIGRCVNDAMDAAEQLSAQGIESTVVNARFVKPLDADLILDLAEKIKNVVTIEEHVLAGGFGSAILELICDNGLSGCRVKRVGINDVFVEHGSQNELRKDYGIDASAVVAAGLKLCREK